MSFTKYGTTQENTIESNLVSHKHQGFMGLSFPLGKRKKEGGFFCKSTGEDLIRDSIIQLLKTKKGERVMHPSFGVNLEQFLFQPLDEDTFTEIRDEIVTAFNRYISGANITKLQVIEQEASNLTGSNALTITLTVDLIDYQNKSFDVKVDIK